MVDAKCFVCFQPNHLEAIKTALLCKILQNLDPDMACDPTSLMSSATCFLCFEPRQQAAIQTQLLCSILASGGGAGGTGVDCGIVNPTIDPGVACQLYFNTANSTLWAWNDGAGAWESLII